LRFWPDAILPAAPTQREAGKRRLYQEDVVFLAAVLLRISDLVPTTELLEGVAGPLLEADQGKTPFDRMWRRIKGGRAAAPAYLCAALPSAARDAVFLIERGLANFNPSNAPVVVLNLTTVLEELSAVVADEEEQ
jgi:hypothetical protein